MKNKNEKLIKVPIFKKEKYLKTSKMFEPVINLL